MNTKIREWMPQYAKLADAHLKGKYGKGLDDFFPPEDYQLMHIELFPHNIIHAECLGGDIDLLSGKRVTVGCFPWSSRAGSPASAASSPSRRSRPPSGRSFGDAPFVVL